MAASITPRSDQINADDLLTGPRTVTITDVKRGTAEQPVDIITAEYGTGRAYKPSKSMRRIIVAAWGKDSAAYVGRRLTIYCDPEITFGRDKVGGIRISHLSHIDKPLQVALTVTRGRRATFTVQPLPDTPPAIAEFEQRIAAAETMSDLETVAEALKSQDLGDHHTHLLSAYMGRRTEIEGTEA